MQNDGLNMDEFFKKAADDVKASYNADFWKDVESQLNDDAMDQAYIRAAEGSILDFTMPSVDELSDSFLDDAFNDASKQHQVLYQPEFWNEFLANEEVYLQDVAFNEASNATHFDYHPAYWSDADVALQSEGLHYEYKSAYWDEVKLMLDNSDRRVFFMRWSLVASVLLLLSFGFYYQSTTNTSTILVEENKSEIQNSISTLAVVSSDDLINASSFSASESNSEISEHIDLRVDVNFNQQNSVQHSVTVNNFNNQFVSTENNTDSGSQNIALKDDGALVDFDENNDNRNQFNNDVVIADNQIENQENQIENNEAKSDAEMGSNLNVTENNNLNEGLFSIAHPEWNNNKENHTAILSAPDIEINKFVPRPSHELSLIAASGFGNRYSKVEFVPSWRNQFGFEYMRKGYGKLNALSLGFNITMNHGRQNAIGTERRVNVYNEDGGIDKLWYKLQLKDMFYANASFVGALDLTRKQSFKFSVGIDYLMFVQSNMSYQVDADAGITTVNNNWGVKEGLSKFDIKLGLGYEFKFTPTISGIANAGIGFLDRTDDQFIQKSIFDQEMNFTLGIKYSFLRKP